MTKRTTSTSTPARAPAMAIAACTMQLTGGNEIQLLPVGAFRARDGRPTEVDAWHIDAAKAAIVIAAADQRATPYVIDYEHQTLLVKVNGKEAPASGWFKKLEWREGQGLFAVDVKWTPRAKAMIDDKEYQFISPVFTYDEVTGDVTGMLMAALTNNPALDGMDAVLIAAASYQFDIPTTTQENPMEQLLEQLRWLLNLPVGATADDIKAQLQKLMDTIKQDTTAAAAASFDLVAHLVNQRTAMAALTNAAPDPAKYVPISVVTGMQAQIAVLSASGATNQVDVLVKGALTAGKLLPVQEAWARDLGKQNIAALTAFLDQAPPMAILSGTQTGGAPPNGGAGPGVAVLTAEQKALCVAFGMDEDEYLATLRTLDRA